MAHKPERDLRPVNSSFPDIYILLLDGYANNNNLKKYWHFSNDPFLDSLRKDGFFVLGSSLSNYPYTVQTVSTMLNMDYHQTSYALTDNPFLLEIANNKTVDLLSDKGYQIHNFSLFDFNTHPSPFHLAVFSEKSLMAHFINQTVFYFVSFNQSQENVLSTVTLDRERKLVSKVVELTKQASDQPKFVYGHFFLTHPPFI
ncbi:hypothetical protein GO730_13685 [Spirosoma sp. HMF3257]|nr:hypothetical protein [Spirosoma telluris]